jgi:hypothetical protein
MRSGGLVCKFEVSTLYDEISVNKYVILLFAGPAIFFFFREFRVISGVILPQYYGNMVSLNYVLERTA